MRQRRKLGAVLAAVLIASLLTTAGPSQAGAFAPSGGQAPAASGQAPPRTVTLVTGDRITVHARGDVSMTPRKGVRYLDYTHKGHHYVIPTDALPLLRENRLDRRLFDITGLLAAGYDRRDTLPLLVTGGEPKGLKASRSLPAIRGYAVSATPANLRAQWQTLAGQQGTKIWLDGLRKPSLDVTVPQIGAPTAWGSGLDGTGVKVAVLDTGIDTAHPDLAGKVVAARNFAAEMEDERDHVGHGTHVASTIAGSGAASGGKYQGVAPGASLLDGKVCIELGCLESWILDGMQWAAESGAHVVNMSLGGSDTPEIDPLEQAVNELTAQYGTLFVIAAGNSGSGEYTLSSPASAEAALAVGAVDKSGALAGFSSRGPRLGDAGVKPEITAPGVAVVAARSKDGFLGSPNQPYMPLSGTSMATPHVAGAAAIVTQQHPQWTAQQRKAVLTGSAGPLGDDGPFDQGAGRVDVARAITANVSSDPVTVAFGVQTWPHEDDPVLTKEVTYSNTGTADVTLQLALSDTVGGTFSLSASTVTVPAGGTAKVSLTADTRQGTATGPLGGRIVATADGGVRVQTPYGVDREEQKYVVQFVHTDRAGKPAENYVTIAFDLERFKDHWVSDPDGTAEMRLPAGTYFTFSWIDTVDEGGMPVNVTQLMWPKLPVSGDRTVQMDARQGGAFKVSIPDKSLTQLLATVDGTLRFADGGIGAGVATDSYDQVFGAHLGPKPVAGFFAGTQGIYGRIVGEELDPSILNSFAFEQEGTFYQGFTRDIRPRDVATLREDAASAGPALGGVTRFPRLTGGAWAVTLTRDLPGTGTSVVNTETAWGVEFGEAILDPEGYPEPVSVVLEDKEYEAGRTYHERFNRAVFGPALPPSPFPDEWVSRTGDRIVVIGAVFGDAQGRAGFSVTDKARAALYRNGELVGEAEDVGAYFDVPAGNARYRAEVSAERGAPFRLTTKVSTAWTFNSSHVDKTKRLPVTAIGFRPQLDDHNTAPASAHLLIPLDVRQQEGSDAGRLTSLTVAVSFDDGATWQDVRVHNLLGHRFVLVKNPGAAGFVSLRAAAQDRGGNTVEQTVIRAYEVR